MLMVHRLGALRSAGARSARLLLALAVLGGALTLTVARAEPAWAYTISRSPTEIVITSERLHDVTVRATETIILRSNGDIIFRIDAHNSGRTRKFFGADGRFTSPATNIQENFYENCIRIPGDTYHGWEQRRSNPTLATRWNDVLNDPNLSAHFRLDASRTDPC